MNKFSTQATVKGILALFLLVTGLSVAAISVSNKKSGDFKTSSRAAGACPVTAYSDYFDTLNSTRWTMLQGGSISANGTLVLNSIPPAGVTKVQHVPTFTPGTYSDYRFDIDFVPVSIPTGTTQYQAVELHNTPGSSSFLIFKLQSSSNSRSSSLVYVTPGQSQTLVNRAVTHNNPLTLRIERIGTTYNFWLNNTGTGADLTLMTTWTGNINPGEIILETWGSTQAQFDNFYFYCPGDPVPTPIPPTPTPTLTPTTTPTPTITPTPTVTPVITPTPGPAACTFQSTWGSQGTLNGQFRNPRQVALDSQGSVYVSDYSNQRIQKFTSTGSFLTKWGILGSAPGQFSAGPMGLDTDSSNNVYVADFDNSRIQKFDSSGNFLLSWGTQGFGNGQFFFAQGVAVDRATNTIYTIDLGKAIQKFGATGNFQLKWSTLSTGENSFTQPSDIAVDSSGFVYIVTTGGANGGDHLVKKYDSSGNLISKWPTGGTDDKGITVDSSGFVYVADAGTHRLRKFSPAGTLVTSLDSTTIPFLNFKNPFDAVINSQGIMYVADWGNNRVQKFSCDVSATPTPSPTLPPPTLTPTGTPTIIDLAFKIRFQSVNSQRPPQTVSMSLVQADMVSGGNIQFNSDPSGVYTGTFSFTAGSLPPGTYDVYIKGPSHLRKKFPGFVLPSQSTTVDLTHLPLIAGDVWGLNGQPDNTIQLNDVTAFISQWTQSNVPVISANSKYDLNMNGNLNLLDISILLNNWTSPIVHGD